MTFSEKLKILLGRSGMSESELAGRLGADEDDVYAWESGSSLPPVEKLIEIAGIFGTSVDTLVKDEISLALSRGAGNAYTDGVPSDSPGYTDDCPTGEFTVPDEYETESDLSVPEETEEPENKKNKKRFPFKIVTALCICAAVIVLSLAAVMTGMFKRATNEITKSKDRYPFVLVHGMGGWGSDSEMNSRSVYWGSDTGSIAEYMSEDGYVVFAPSVGPFSSAWDRACELYAALAGTTVDYGQAHSEAHHHARYGREYTAPLFDGWGSGKKINLVGHSFGGNTVRLLTYLLEYGDEAEKEISGSDVSPLFEGGKGKYVNSVTTLCSPHNGSTLYYIANKYGLTESTITPILSLLGVTGVPALSDAYDFRLDQFGITSKGADLSDITTFVSNSDDSAIYDLSPDAAARFNSKIKTVDGVYYFSYACSTTEKSKVSDSHIPRLSTLTVLKATALLMGKYSKNRVTDYEIDASWLENDGLVNLVSALYPFTDPHTDFDSGNISKGEWNVMPVITGDHGKVIGMNQSESYIRGFYGKMFGMINAL